MNQLLILSNVMLWLLNIFLLFAVFLIFRQFGAVYLHSAEAIARDGIRLGAAMPPFCGVRYEEGTVLTREELHGVPVLMAFVSPTCPACRQLLDDWNDVYGKHCAHIRFVLVALGDEGQVTQLVGGKQLHGDVVMDNEGTIMTDFKVRVTPFAFVLDRTGVVRGKGLCNGEQHLEGLLVKLGRYLG